MFPCTLCAQEAAWSHCQHEYLHLNATVNVLPWTTWHVCMFALYTLITCAVFNQKQKGKCNVKNSYIIVTYLFSRIKACHITFAALFLVSVATMCCCTTPNFIMANYGKTKSALIKPLFPLILHLICWHHMSLHSNSPAPFGLCTRHSANVFHWSSRQKRKPCFWAGARRQSLNLDKMHSYHGHREKNKECMWKILKVVSPSAQCGSN